MSKQVNQPSNSSDTYIKVKWVPITWEGAEEPELPFPKEWEVPLNIGMNAAISAVMTGFDKMIKEGGKSFEEYQAGKIDSKQFTYRIVHKGTQAAVKGGVRTGAALGLAEGAKQVILRKWGEEVLRKVNRRNLVGALAFAMVDQTGHTYAWYKGQLTLREYKIKSIENIGSTGGAMGGAAAGAMLGSVIPGAGTAMGAMLGYMLASFGAMGGASVGKQLGEDWFPEQEKKTEDK